VPLISPPPEPTAESVTVPLFTIDCTLLDPELQTNRAVFRQSGGRGYVDKSQASGSARVRRTPISFVAIRDETGDFSSRELSGEWVERDFPYRIGAKLPGDPSLAQQMTLRFQRGQGDRLAVMISARNESYQKYVGQCDLSSTPQAPLTSDETEDLVQ